MAREPDVTFDDCIWLAWYFLNTIVTNRPATRGAKPTLENFSLPLEKCVGHNLIILDIVPKILAPLGKIFAPPGVPTPSWLRACLQMKLFL